MALGQIGFQLQGKISFLSRFLLPGIERFIEVKDRYVRDGECRVGGSKFGIELDRFTE